MIFKGVRPGKVESLCITAATFILSWIPAVNFDFPLRFLGPFADIPRTSVESLSFGKTMSVFALQFSLYLHIFISGCFRGTKLPPCSGLLGSRGRASASGYSEQIRYLLPGMQSPCWQRCRAKDPSGGDTYISAMLSQCKWAQCSEPSAAAGGSGPLQQGSSFLVLILHRSVHHSSSRLPHFPVFPLLRK